MSAEVLALFGGIVVSLVFSYVPGVKPVFSALSPDYKRLVNLGALVLVAAGALGLSCIGRYNIFTCDVNGAWNALEVLVLAAIANQSAFLLTPKGKG